MHEPLKAKSNDFKSFKWFAFSCPTKQQTKKPIQFLRKSFSCEFTNSFPISPIPITSSNCVSGKHNPPIITKKYIIQVTKSFCNDRMFSLQIKNKHRNLKDLFLHIFPEIYSTSICIEKWRELVFSLKHQMWMALTSFLSL